MVPGTACNAIYHALDGRFSSVSSIPESDIMEGDKLLVGAIHSSIPNLLKHKVIDRQLVSEYFTVANIRNPFDRFVTQYVRLAGTWWEELREKDNWKRFQTISSGYHFKRQQQLKRQINQARQLDFNSWLRRRISSQMTRRKRLERWWRRLRQPVDMPFVFPLLVGVKEYIRYENLEGDLNRILKKTGAIPKDEVLQVPRNNVTGGKKPYQEYYDQEMRQEVERVFALELNYFGYTFDGLNTKVNLAE